MCLPMKVSWETNVSVTEYKKSCIYPDPCTSTVSELYEQHNKPFDVWKKISNCFGKHIPDFRHECFLKRDQCVEFIAWNQNNLDMT